MKTGFDYQIRLVMDNSIQDWENEGGMAVTSGYVYSCTKCKTEILTPEDAEAYKEYQICVECKARAFPNE